MRTAKNYACHRVYDGAHHFLSQSVVSINEDGEVMDCKPLSQETAVLNLAKQYINDNIES